jgi:hypothetical protein
MSLQKTKEITTLKNEFENNLVTILRSVHGAMGIYYVNDSGRAVE